MPFTLAHPAVAVPIARAMGGRASLSALVIGSMIPDVVYFLPLGVDGWASHSLAGLFWFCIPVGTVAFLLFHLLAKRPAAALLPHSLSRRLPESVFNGPLLGAVPLPGVILSVGLGALSHIGWDAFTHSHSVVVQRLPLLQARLGAIAGIEVRVYKALQYVSSAIGMLALMFWSYRWARSSPPVRNPYEASSLSLKVRMFVLGAIAAAGLAFGAAKGVAASFGSAEYILIRSLVGGLRGVGFACVIFCVGWHFHATYRRISS